MCVAKGRIGEEHPVLIPKTRYHRFWSVRVQDLLEGAGRGPPTRLGRRHRRSPEVGPGQARRLRTLDLAVHRDMADVAKQTGPPVLPRTEIQEFGVCRDEARVRASGFELGMRDHVFQEPEVGLETPDPEFQEGAVHLADRVLEPRGVRADLHQQ